jgi:hypothetical protein
MSVASCRTVFLLSDAVFSHMCCLVSFRILLRELNSDLWLCVPRDFDPQCGPAQPDPARPSSTRAPLAPVPSPCAPPSPGLSPSFQFSRAATSSSPTSLSPRGALGLGDGDHRNLDPGGELPSPLLLSVTPLVLLQLKLEHNIIIIGIAYV